MENKKIRVAITHGDTNGIGYELIFKTFADAEMLELCTPIVYGSPKLAAYHRNALNMEASFSIINRAEDAEEGRVNLLTCFDDEVKADIGTPTPESGQAALQALDRAMTDYRKELFDALVCLPVSNAHINVGGTPFKGHAEYITTCLGEGRKALPVYLTESMRMAIAADGVAMKDVPQILSESYLETAVKTLHEALRRDLRVYNPRIALLALNSNADGNEENEVMRPVVKKLNDQKVGVFGPYPADTFFGEQQYKVFDLVLAIYHDQGIVPLKTLSYDQAHIAYCGLPLVCTTTDDTPRFDIAGKGVADEGSFRQAIYTAIDIVRNRQTFDEPLANPLPKLYHERRDESEKIRFNIPKKKEE